MRYPLKLTPFSAELAIYIPDYEQVKEVYEAILIDHAAEPFPYWAKLWPSSIALVQYLNANTIWIEHKNVLEIGAGLGLPSFMIAGYANSVQVSDYAPEAVELLEKNIQHLRLHNVQAMELDWNRVPDSIKPDVVLLSDVNYNPGQFDGLLQLITKLIANGTIVLLSTPQRIMASPFVNAIQELVKQSHVEIVNENGKSIEISILILFK
jgi:predicted nicotinamide N-methyase